MVRKCEKCGKTNQPTRKFCIRCGASLIKAPKPEPARAPLPPAQTSEKSKAIVGSEQAPPPDSATPAANDQWVKPSEVARDRVRMAGGSARGKSEFEKAKEAFARAETVGIDEEGTGVIETRMLRASEVKELLEGPGMMDGSEEVPQPTMMAGSEPVPPEAQELMRPAAPSQSQIEKQILGSKSGFVEQEKPPPEAPPVLEATTVEAEVTPELSAEFTSSKYEEEAVAKPAPASTPPPQAAAADVDEDSLDLVIACPSCGGILNIDMFEYPPEVYSAMGDARLKQARFFVVQGQNDDAKRIVDVATALYEKAGDKKGIAEAEKLRKSLK